jgi:hypothetical protein
MAGNLWDIYGLMNQSFEVYKLVWLTVDGTQLINKRRAVSSLHWRAKWIEVRWPSPLYFWICEALFYNRHYS